ncbi:MAG: ACT domain-containing protein, partial [Allisonella histaminiformans]|uniref:ACT domain-containing protein n=1 Tax=Allisonella histaminiformans TaxID=209880 RepID=UPI002A800DE6
VPGDEIIGYITRGRGVTVHRLDCPNIVNTDEPERLIEVTWIKQTSGTFQVNIEIISYDRTGLMADILAVLSDNKTSVSSANINVNDAGVATMRLGIQIKDLQQLEYITTKIRRVKGVHSVERLKGRKGN